MIFFLSSAPYILKLPLRYMGFNYQEWIFFQAAEFPRISPLSLHCSSSSRPSKSGIARESLKISIDMNLLIDNYIIDQ